MKKEDMKNKYYVCAAYDAGSGHGDELHLIMLNDGRIIGYSSEFDVCTTDIADACSVEKCKCANWFYWDDKWEWRPATLNELKAQGLERYLTGSKKDMKIGTSIEPL